MTPNGSDGDDSTKLLWAISAILCIQGVEEQTVDDLPLLICGSNLQQWRSAKIHTAELIRWGGSRDRRSESESENFSMLTKEMKSKYTFSFLENLFLLWSTRLQGIYKRCPEIKGDENKRDESV